jgi:hypothetical protein
MNSGVVLLRALNTPPMMTITDPAQRSGLRPNLRAAQSAGMGNTMLGRKMAAEMTPNLLPRPMHPYS